MYMNVFRSRKRADMDLAAYHADAARMVELACAQPGFVSYKTFAAEDGETVTISEWESREHAQAWARNAEHAAVQGRGRAEYYESYTVHSCTDPEVRQFRRESPE